LGDKAACDSALISCLGDRCDGILNACWDAGVKLLVDVIGLALFRHHSNKCTCNIGDSGYGNPLLEDARIIIDCSDCPDCTTSVCVVKLNNGGYGFYSCVKTCGGPECPTPSPTPSQTLSTRYTTLSAPVFEDFEDSNPYNPDIVQYWLSFN
jgi:hypothetical protein